MGKLLHFGLIFILLPACKKNTPDPVTPPAKATYYFHATIGGSSVLFEETAASGYGSGGWNGTGTTDSGWLAEQGSYLLKPFLPGNAAGYELIKNFPFEPIGPEYEAMFHTGSYSFGNREEWTGLNPVNGVVVQYYDASGDEWATDLGSADQTGSNFTITSHASNGLGNGYSVTKATFNCMLYDSTGNVKVLTGGEYAGRSLLY